MPCPVFSTAGLWASQAATCCQSAAFLLFLIWTVFVENGLFRMLHLPGPSLNLPFWSTQSLAGAGHWGPAEVPVLVPAAP